MRFVLSLLTLALIGFGALAFYTYFEFTKERTYQNESLIIERGMSGRAIARTVAQEGNIPEIAAIIAKRFTTQNAVQAGEYDLSDNPSLATVFERLNTADMIARNITVPEGLTVYQVIKLIQSEPLITNDCPDYKVVAEGSLLPETYAFLRGEPCRSILNRMNIAMNKALDEAWAERQSDLPYETPQEALIMASIIERETGVIDERAKVAGVFVNRLRIGMPLQSDPTTIYAMSDGKGFIDRPLYRSDWALEHPINTYHINNLPPQAIANPGIASIKAALNPSAHDYLYFVATGTGDGGHNFSKTLDAHNRNIVSMKNEKRARRSE